MTHFRDRRDFDATIDAAAERLGVDPVIIEKDDWVSQILRGVADQFPGDFIFKGGTSLSRCYGLIQRFSEDIDLLIRPGERGRNATDRMLKEMAGAAGGALDCPPESIERVESGLGEHRKVRVFYPTGRPGVPGVKPGVLLEMGIRGGEEPHMELPAPGQHRQAVQQATHEQVDDRNDHTAMIPDHRPRQAHSGNRAPKVRLCDGFEASTRYLRVVQTSMSRIAAFTARIGAGTRGHRTTTVSQPLSPTWLRRIRRRKILGGLINENEQVA